MILDNLLEFCKRDEHKNAFQVKDLDSYIIYFLAHGLWDYVERDGEIVGVAFARLIESRSDREFNWKPHQDKGDYLVIDSVVAFDKEVKKTLMESLNRIIRTHNPKRVFMMRHEKWRELTHNLRSRMQWEQE